MSKAGKQQRRDVPSNHHVARYCNPQRVMRDPKTEAIIGVFPEAFALRKELPVRETYLSTHWMEDFGVDINIDAQFQAVISALRKKHSNVRSTGAFTRLNAGRIVAAGVERGHRVRVRDRSSPKDPGYAEISGTPLDNSDRELLARFANDCCTEIRGVADIDALS